MGRLLDVLLYLDDPARAREQMRNRVVVLVDVLRATTTLTIAFANGLRSATPVLTPEEALSKRKELPHLLLGGEREGLPLEGFDLGNSPAEYVPKRVRHRDLIFTTTNGTRLMEAASSARRAFLGCFANREAICRKLCAEENDILMACAGNENLFTIEDVLFAGACIVLLEERFELTDAAFACRILWEACRERLVETIASGKHGRRLIQLGFERDIFLAAQLDTTTVVPELKNGRLFVPAQNGDQDHLSPSRGSA